MNGPPWDDGGPGPRSRALSRALRRDEAPGINTLYGGEDALVWEEAEGFRVRDVDGREYLDLTSGFGVAAVGHRHPSVVAAVRDQAGRLLHGLGDVAAHPARIALAGRLADRAPIDDAQVYFAVSGADAVEIALKTALLATGRSGVLAFDPGYHGLTAGALAVTSRPAFRAPFAAHLNPRVVRQPFAGPIDQVRETLETHDIGCVVVEPIVGREGVLIPPEGWLASLRDAAREVGAVLAIDEIFTGFGRTGRMFACEHDGVEPDLLCCGKALGGGLPIGAVVGRRDLMAAWDDPGEARHTATFVAHPLACAAALAVLDLIDPPLLDRVVATGRHLARRVETWPGRFEAVRSVRGRGMLFGIDLRDRATAGRAMIEARRRGVLWLAGGPEGRTAQLVPPLVATTADLDEALDRLEATLSTEYGESAAHA